MSYIYVLRLEEGKYYVGKTSNLENRFETHLQGKGSRWTKRYKPIEMIENYESFSAFDEDKTTKEYMASYGIDNVRGGSYVTKKISDDERVFIQREIWMALGRCTKCGSDKHISRFCKEI